MTCGTAPADAPGVVVAAVASRSPAERGELRPGDRILAINGHPLRDSIDFHFHSGEERLRLTVERNGRQRSLMLERRAARLGLELEPPRPSEISTCANKCVFCFIHQLPRGMRRSLYVKDDDFRLSFLHGNYITLTDLEEDDLTRIEEQRLSPLYVSVHATDPELRHRLLGSPHVRRELLPIMERLAKAGIAMHAQVVLVPDWNDGAHLEHTVRDLARLHPGVTTAAVVPVGLTRHRQRLPALRAVTQAEARTVVADIERWQGELLRPLGTRFVFAADELYLQAGRPLPPATAYEGFAVAEDGIGLVRRFEDGFGRSLRRIPARIERRREVTVVTGQLYAPRMAALLARLRIEGLSARLAPVINDWFGHGIGVAGLLTGRDVQSQLANRELGDEVLIPAVALRDGAGVFLDDMTPADLAAALRVRVTAVEPTAPELIAALLGR